MLLTTQSDIVHLFLWPSFNQGNYTVTLIPGDGTSFVVCGCCLVRGELTSRLPAACLPSLSPRYRT